MDTEKEEEEEDDPFASIIKLCEPTASQEAKFPNCRMAREFENFSDSDSDHFSSPSNSTGIVMVSLPATPASIRQDDAVFHTPPEHPPHSHPPSSEEQNHLHGLSARVSEAESHDDEPDAKRIRVSGDEFDGETVPVAETEVIEIEGDDDTEVIVLDSGDSVATVNLGEDSLDVAREGVTVDEVRKDGELMKCGTPKVDANAVNGDHELGVKCKSMEVNKGEKTNENSDLSGSLDSSRIEEEIVRIRSIVGNRCIEVRQESSVGGSERVGKITKDVNMAKDGHGDGTDGTRNEEIGRKANGKRVEDIDKFKYVGDADGGWKGGSSRGVGGSGRKRQLPESLKGKERDVGGSNVEETVETESGLLEFLDVLKVIVGNTNGDSEDVDFLETAKMRGLTFPKPRWWPSEDEDDE